MAARISISETGKPEVMRLEDVKEIAPQEGEVWLEQDYIGVNFLDVTQRNGAAKVPLPSGLGFEAAGVVAKAGPGVRNVKEGDRVAYATGPIGAYATGRIYPADRLIMLPNYIASQDAAAILFKGITAQYLLKATYPVVPGSTVMLYGPTGALGQILVRWAKHLGASVFGIVSSEEKVDSARLKGCDEVFVLGTVDIPAEVRRANAGKGVDVVYDPIGHDSLPVSLDSLRPRGMLVSFGAASGAPAPIDVGVLNQKGSLYLTRPSIFAYTADPSEYKHRAEDVMSSLSDGVIHASIWKTYALKDAVEAHRDLEGRVSRGAIILKA